MTRRSTLHPEATPDRRQPAASAVEIEIIGALAAIDLPPLPDLVHDRLEYHDTIFEPGGPLGHRSRDITVRLYDIDARGRLVVPAGAVPGICQVLRQHNYRVTIGDYRQRPPRCQHANDAILAELNDHEQRLVEVVTTNPGTDHGPWPGRDGAGRREPLPLLAGGDRAGARGDQAARRSASRCPRRTSPGAVSKAHGGAWASKFSRIVCTYRSLETCTSDAVDMVIFSEVETMFNQRNLPRHRGPARRDPAFCRRPGRRAARSCLPGPPGSPVRAGNLASPDPRGEPAGVRVMVCEGPYMGKILSDGALDRKRKAIWHNTPRNRMVAEIAAALAADKQEALWKHGIGLENDQIDLGAGTLARVAVPVEGPEHGRNLQKLLPGWPLLTAIPPAQGGGNEANNSSTLMLPDQSIVTLVYAGRMKQLDPNVLIVASADDWTREIMSFPPRFKQPTAPLPREVLVIDLVDDYDDTAIRNTQQRLDAYRCRGWRLTGPRRWTDQVEPAGRSRPLHRP